MSDEQIIGLLQSRKILDIKNLLDYATDKDKRAEVIINNKPELSTFDVENLLYNTNDKDKMAKIIISKKSNLYSVVKKLITYAKDKDKIAKLIIEKKTELTDTNVLDLLHNVTNKDKIAELIIKYKTELTYENVSGLIRYAPDKEKDKIAELIIKKQPELFNRSVSELLRYATDKEKIAGLLGTDNINKLSDKNISSLLDNANHRREQMAKIIIKYKSELSGDDVAYLTSNIEDNNEILELILNNLRQSKYPVHDKAIGWIFDRSKDKDKVINDMIQILKEKNQEISTYSFEKFIQHATDKLKMAMTLIKIKKQLSLEEASILIRNAKDRNEMVKLIDKPYSFLKSLTSWDAFRYKKSPEVQDMINQELKRRKRSRFSSDFD